MRRYLGNDGMLWFFAAMAGINFIFVLTMVPETKGYSLEDISRIWSQAKVTDHALGTTG
jgi:hypothetical protein